jgi:signal transduction histidine kinase
MIILFAVAISAGQQDGNDVLLQQYSEELSSWLTNQDAAARHQFDPKTDRRDQQEAVYTVIRHRSDTILDYNNNFIIPSSYNLKQFAEKPGRSLMHLPQGWFYVVSSTQQNDVKTVLIPIRYTLNTGNLPGAALFPANKNISAHLEISRDKTGYPVAVDGQAMCWLQASGPLQSGWLSWIKLGAWTLFFITFFSLLNQAARWLNERFGTVYGALLLLVLIGGLLFYNQQAGWTSLQFGSLPLFQQTFNGASLIGNSIGDWLLHVALLVFLMAFFHRSFRAKPLAQLPLGLRFGLAFLCNLLMALSIPVLILVVRQLIFNSRPGFDFDNILGIGTSGFLALTGLIGLIIGLFLFGHRLILTVRSFELSMPQRFGAIAVAILLLAGLAIPMDINPLHVMGFALLYAVAMDLFVHWEGNGFGWLVVWLLLFSLLSSFLLFRNNAENDRNQRLAYAQALVVARDTTFAERVLPRLRAAILQDSIQISQTLKPWPFKAEKEALRAQLNAIALQEPYLFQHYHLNVAAFDNENQPILLGQTLGYQEVVHDNWDEAQPVDNQANIRYLSGGGGGFRYLLRFAMTRAEDVQQRVQMFVLLDQEHPAPALAYTQIFYNSPYKNLDHLSRYSFAVQKNGRILVEQGRGSLASLTSDVGKGEAVNVETKAPHRVDAVAKSADGQTIASVGHTLGGWLKQVYLFSILFTLSSLLLLALAFANSWLNFLPTAYDFRLTAKGSLARRIHLWNVSLLAASFLVVGFLTYQHFMDNARETENSAFDYRAEALQNNLEAPFLNKIDSSSNPIDLTTSLQKITSSLNIDAHFFSAKGELLFSTQEDLVLMGILPSRMNVDARDVLTKTNLPTVDAQEQAGGNKYITQYRPCRNGKGELLGFLSVPRPSGKNAIGSEVSDFIGMLASLYVFLLLIAFVITYFLSRSIIRPLSLLSEKVQELKLEDKNAPLEYAGDAQDEISELIGQYNSMVDKLEVSKVQLVRLEREGAWREMAKQVAHDIKNPLTTMKLSMQQLERVSNNPEQAAAYLRKAITRLIEQIDSLAQIASEFSMFANLDIRNKNDVVINEVVESVHDLFSEQKNVQLELKLPKEIYHILGDKNHLIRVFNNLVINAIQSIPSDREGHIRVSLFRQDKLSVIKISDNGGGIPPEIGERVFEPNFTTKTSGSGLGLAICKKIIEAHDGNIRFETRENEGTDFFVEIPITAVLKL